MKQVSLFSSETGIQRMQSIIRVYNVFRFRTGNARRVKSVLNFNFGTVTTDP